MTLLITAAAAAIFLTLVSVFTARRWRSLSAAGLVWLTAVASAAANDPLIPAGAARIEISPQHPAPLMGYASRAALPRNNTIAQPIYARALALGADAELAILFTIDTCILPASAAEAVRKRLRENHKVPPERIAITVTHTHSAPSLTGAAPNIFAADYSPEDEEAIARYTAFFLDQLVKVAAEAVAAREPAVLSWTRGRASFAKNRRTPGGPVDHEMPLLRVASPSGETRALFVNYACHCTTLVGDFNAVHGDWAGVAAELMEREHPQAVGLVAIGCGADSNPEPRGTIELVQRHGAEIAAEVQRLLATKLEPLPGAPACKLTHLELPYQRHFTREEWEQRAGQSGVVGYHARKWLARLDPGETPPPALKYPVQTWSFGDQLALVFLGGEVVVDYALRLKRELNGARLWITAYSNDVPCYIPSRRILAEGGYEAEFSLWYYDRPQRLAPEIEDLIIGAVGELLPPVFRAAKPNSAGAQ